MKKGFLSIVMIAMVLLGVGFQRTSLGATQTFGNGDLKGNYIYSLQGPTSGGDISEIGIFTADGNSPVGKITAVAQTFLNGLEVAPPNTLVWDCEYSVTSNGFVDITCERVDFGVPNIKWSMVIDGSKKEVRFQAGGNQPGFGNVDIQGSGTHQ